MPATKRNEFLDAGSSDDEGVGSGYEEQESRAARAPKRRRVERDDEDEEASDSENGLDRDDSVDNDEDDDIPGGTTSTTQPRTLPHTQKPTISITTKPPPLPDARRSLAPTPSSEHKTGVIYLSRIPPFLKPSALRTLLSPFGTVLRIFLTPEPASFYAARRRAGGNKKRSYADGWAEFARRRDAKTCAAALNAQLVGGKKGGWYHDDVWNVKYLKGFQWRHLTEQIANENAERAARLRKEVGEARREDRRFLENVERAKVDEGMRRKREGKVGGAGGSGVVQEVEASRAGKVKDKVPQRRFTQNKLAPIVEAKKGPAKEQPEEVKRVLSKIF